MSQWTSFLLATSTIFLQTTAAAAAKVALTINIYCGRTMEKKTVFSLDKMKINKKKKKKPPKKQKSSKYKIVM